MKKLTVILGSAATIFATFAFAAAQEPPASTNAAPIVQQQQRRRMALRMMMRRRARRGMMRALRSLNLTEAQKQQAREIMRANFENTRGQQQQLAELRRKFREGTLTSDDQAKAKELRQQLHASRQNARTQLAALLTPEQKTQLEEMIKNRREHRGRFLRRGQSPNKPI